MKEGISKGLDKIWASLKLNPIKEAMLSLTGIVQGQKRVRNTFYFLALAGGMAGGCVLFIEAPAFYDWGESVIRNFIPEAIFNGFDGIAKGAGDVVADICTGLLGLWIGGAVTGTTAKHTYRAIAYQTGGHTNSDYNFTGKQLDAINEKIGVEFEADPEGTCYTPVRGCMQHCFPIGCLSGIQRRLVSESHWQTQNDRQQEIDQMVSDLDRYKFDNTGRHAQLKHVLNSLRRNFITPLVNYFESRRDNALRRQALAEQTLTTANGQLGIMHALAAEGDDVDLEAGGLFPHDVLAHGAHEPVAGLAPQMQQKLGQVLKFFQSSNHPKRQYNVLPTGAVEPTIRTYGDLWKLRTEAQAQKTKMAQTAESAERMCSRYRGACVLEV